MNKTVLFLVTLIVISFCASSRVKTYQGLVDRLIQLNQDVAASSDAVGLAVSQISRAEDDSQKRSAEIFANMKAKCDSGLNILTLFLDRISKNVVASQSQSHKAAEDNVAIDQSIEGYTTQIKEFKSQLKTKREQIDQAIVNLTVYGSEAEHKLVAIKMLTDIILDELMKADSVPSQASSFVQLNTFKNKLHELKSLLNNAKDGIYEPLVTSLLSLAEKNGFSDQKILQQVLDLLKTLGNNITLFRQKQDTEDRNIIETQKEELKEITVQLTAVAKLFRQANANKKDNEQIIATSTRDVAGLNAENHRKSGEQISWGRICDGQKALGEKLRVVYEGMANHVRELSADSQFAS